jgi:type IV pilus assembly protein PilC
MDLPFSRTSFRIRHMLFSRRLPLSSLVELCRVLRHNLSAGLTLLDVFRQQAKRGSATVRPLAARITESLERGDRFGDALDAEKDVLPPLFLALGKLGESTGRMPEIFAELEKYFQLQWQLVKQFRSKSIMPILQFVFAVFLIAGLLYILGIIADMSRSRPLLTFLGLSGGKASLAFLGCVGGIFSGLLAVYIAMSRTVTRKVAFDRFLLRLPAIGGALHAVVMNRFTLALYITLDSGLTITKALRLSLNATGNAFYAAQGDVVVAALKSGKSLHEALVESCLFSDDFLNLIASSEEGGRVPEMMRHQADYYSEETARKLTALTHVATTVVWLIYAGFVIYAIFKIAAVYLSALGA